MKHNHICENKSCGKFFVTEKKNSRFCSRSCSGFVSSTGQFFSEERRKKIGDSHRGEKHHAWISDRSALSERIQIYAKMRSHLRRVINSRGGPSESRKDPVLGYSFLDLKRFIEDLFSPGMSWENYGHGKDKWNIDHIRPVSSFPLNSDPKTVNDLGNLQPKWQRDNFSKHNHWTGYVVLMDMDEVICEFVQKVLCWYEEDTGKKLTLNDIQTWDMRLNMGPNSEHFMRSYMRYPAFYQELEPIPGSISGFKEILKMGHEVFIVSAVPKCAGLAYEGKLEWLRKNIPDFNLSNFIACSQKDLIDGDILVDDGIHNLDAFRKAGKISICFDRPWNKDWDGLRVHSWNELVELLREFKKNPKL